MWVGYGMLLILFLLLLIMCSIGIDELLFDGVFTKLFHKKTKAWGKRITKKLDKDNL